MIAYQENIQTDLDPELPLSIATAKYACLCGKRTRPCGGQAAGELIFLVFICRAMAPGIDKVGRCCSKLLTIQSELLESLNGYLPTCRDDLLAVTTVPPPQKDSVSRCDKRWTYSRRRLWLS